LNINSINIDDYKKNDLRSQGTQGKESAGIDKSGEKSVEKKEAESKNIHGSNHEFTESEKLLIAELQHIDQAVKRHEMAHVIAGGRFVLAGANYSYKTGPDGKRYAVSGEVKIDTSKVPDDPEATIKKMHSVRRAALAPSDPSPQDRKVASTAMSISTKAMSELIAKRAEEKANAMEEKAFGDKKRAGHALKVNKNCQAPEKTGFKTLA